MNCPTCGAERARCQARYRDAALRVLQCVLVAGHRQELHEDKFGMQFSDPQWVIGEREREVG